MTVVGSRTRSPRERKTVQFRMKLAKVIADEEAAKLISDPMRRAILNLLRRRALTEAELAERLGLTDGTVNYHLRLLRNIGFVTVTHTEVEEHGIMQKFYAPSAYLYLPDVESLPMEVARYYYPINTERIRGVMSAWAPGSPRAVLSFEGADELGEELAKELVRVAKGYLGREVSQGEGEGESLVNEIYTLALSRLTERQRDTTARSL